MKIITYINCMCGGLTAQPNSAVAWGQHIVFAHHVTARQHIMSLRSWHKTNMIHKPDVHARQPSVVHNYSQLQDWTPANCRSTPWLPAEAVLSIATQHAHGHDHLLNDTHSAEVCNAANTPHTVLTCSLFCESGAPASSGRSTPWLPARMGMPGAAGSTMGVSDIWTCGCMCEQAGGDAVCEHRWVLARGLSVCAGKHSLTTCLPAASISLARCAQPSLCSCTAPHLQRLGRPLVHDRRVINTTTPSNQRRGQRHAQPNCRGQLLRRPAFQI